MRFLYPAGQYFCSSDGNKHWTWFPDYQSRWNSAVPKLTNLLKQRKIMGFIIGDESVDKGLSTDHWETIIKTIRATFPRGEAIIYANDYICDDNANPAPPCISHIPAELDWISSAKYRDPPDKSSGFVDSVRHFYKDNIYSKLASHQKVAVVPMIGPAQDICNDKCFAQVELQDAKDFVAWAESDSRVALIAPYVWDGGTGEGLVDMDDADDLKQYWQKYGRATKHSAMKSAQWQLNRSIA